MWNPKGQLYNTYFPRADYVLLSSDIANLFTSKDLIILYLAYNLGALTLL